MVYHIDLLVLLPVLFLLLGGVGDYLGSLEVEELILYLLEVHLGEKFLSDQLVVVPVLLVGDNELFLFELGPNVMRLNFAHHNLVNEQWN